MTTHGKEKKWSRRSLGLKAGDYVVIGGVIALIFRFFSWSFGTGNAEMRLLIVSPGSREYVSLDVNREVLVEGPLGHTRVVIRGGEAWIEEAPCRDKVCITMGKVRRPGEQVVCLPNRVIIEVVGGRSVIDGVSR
jgi:hypothetical protein